MEKMPQDICKGFAHQRIGYFNVAFGMTHMVEIIISTYLIISLLTRLYGIAMASNRTPPPPPPPPHTHTLRKKGREYNCVTLIAAITYVNKQFIHIIGKRSRYIYKLN